MQYKIWTKKCAALIMASALVMADVLPAGAQEKAGIQTDTKTQKKEFTLPISINEENFPDEGFRKLISQIDKNRDGVLADAEADEIKCLDTREAGVEDMEGIQYFSELKDLLCTAESVDGISLENNKSLETVNGRIWKLGDSIDNVPMQSLKLEKSAMTLKAGTSYTLKATAEPETTTDKTVTWTSSNPLTASVDAAGKVTAKKAGKAVITAKSNDGTELTAECTVTVTQIFTVKFDPNGGKASSSSKKVTYDSAYGALPTASRKGYVFAGWYTARSGGSKISSASKVTNTANHTLYARWTAANYKITYKLNGGTNSKSNPSGYKITSNTIALKNPGRKGYSFKGWYSDSKYKKKITKIAKGSTGNKTVYAKWAINTYTLKYKLNGGTLKKANPKTYRVNSSTITLRNPSRKGYSFKGWYSDSKYKNRVTKVTKGSTGSKTLYAKWTVVNYKITYKLNGGTNSKKNPSKYTINSSKITYKNPSRKGYSFKGWYSDSKYKKKVTGIAKKSTGNKTVYAKWSANKYKITYYLNGGKNSKSNPSAYYVYSSNITLKSPSRSGYKFLGWYSDSKYKNKVTTIKKGSTGSRKLYAKWTKVYLYSDSNVTVYYSGVKKSEYMSGTYELTLKVVNKTSKKLMIQADAIAFNGECSADVLGSDTIAAKKTGNAQFDVTVDTSKVSLKNIKTISGQLRIIDAKSMKTIKKAAFTNINKSNGAVSTPSVSNSKYKKLFNNSYMTVYYSKIVKNSYYKNSADVTFRIVNKSNIPFTIQSDYLSLNGVKYDNVIVSDTVLPKTTGTVEITVMGIKNMNVVKSLKSVKGAFRIVEEDYSLRETIQF